MSIESKITFSIGLSLVLITGFISSIIMIEDAFAPPGKPGFKLPHHLARDIRDIAPDPVRSEEPITELQEVP